MAVQPTEPTLTVQPTEPTLTVQPTEPPTEPTLAVLPVEPTQDIHPSEPPVRVKLRKGQYIVTFDKRNAGDIDLNFHVERCLKQSVFNALRKNTVHKVKKPRKLDTVANLTPEQLERKRATRRQYYYNNKEKFNTYAKNRYNNDPVYWEKKLTMAKERYRLLRENVERKKPGRKPRIKDTTPSTTASDNEDHVVDVKPTNNTPKRIGRPRKVHFNNNDHEPEIISINNDES